MELVHGNHSGKLMVTSDGTVFVVVNGGTNPGSEIFHDNNNGDLNEQEHKEEKKVCLFILISFLFKVFLVS